MSEETILEVDLTPAVELLLLLGASVIPDEARGGAKSSVICSALRAHTQNQGTSGVLFYAMKRGDFVCFVSASVSLCGPHSILLPHSVIECWD